jgi:Flp pilus assembly protein TadG
MRNRTSLTNRRRRGATIVETALVMAVFFMLLFGIFEYCRFLMVLHIANNAARDGARYAAVNVGTDLTAKQIQDYTTARMGGVDQNLSGFQATVYPCDPSGFALNPPQAIPKSSNPPWNQAAFTERIAVQIQGSYQPITPLLLLLPSSIPITITAVVGSEG